MIQIWPYGISTNKKLSEKKKSHRIPVGFRDKNREPKSNQKTRPRVNPPAPPKKTATTINKQTKKKGTYYLVDFTVFSVDHRVKIKRRQNLEKYLEFKKKKCCK